MNVNLATVIKGKYYCNNMGENGERRQMSREREEKAEGKGESIHLQQCIMKKSKNNL